LRRARERVVVTASAKQNAPVDDRGVSLRESA